jgi:hypothetical protein
MAAVSGSLAGRLPCAAPCVDATITEATGRGQAPRLAGRRCAAHPAILSPCGKAFRVCEAIVWFRQGGNPRVSAGNDDFAELARHLLTGLADDCARLPLRRTARFPVERCVTLANSISAPAIAASAAVSGQGAKAATAGAATVVPSMFAQHLGSLGGDVSARALSAAQGAGAGGPVNAPVAGGAMASATVTGLLSASGPGSATATGPLIAGVTAAQTTGAPFAIPAVGLGMFGTAGPGGASVLPATPAGSDGTASAAPGAAATWSAALAGDAATETEAATPPGAGAPLTLESMAPASMSAPFAPVPSPVAGAGPLRDRSGGTCRRRGRQIDRCEGQCAWRCVRRR